MDIEKSSFVKIEDRVDLSFFDDTHSKVFRSDSHTVTVESAYIIFCTVKEAYLPTIYTVKAVAGTKCIGQCAVVTGRMRLLNSLSSTLGTKISKMAPIVRS